MVHGLRTTGTCLRGATCPLLRCHMGPELSAEKGRIGEEGFTGLGRRPETCVRMGTR